MKQCSVCSLEVPNDIFTSCPNCGSVLIDKTRSHIDEKGNCHYAHTGRYNEVLKPEEKDNTVTEGKEDWLHILRRNNPNNGGIPGWVLNSFVEYKQQMSSPSDQAWQEFIKTPKGQQVLNNIPSN